MDRLRAEAAAEAEAQSAAEGRLTSAEVRAAVAAAREDLAARERSIQAKALAIEAKTKDITRMLLGERDNVSAQVAAMQARVDAAEAERASALQDKAELAAALAEAQALR
jgi:hypothetical protein